MWQALLSRWPVCAAVDTEGMGLGVNSILPWGRGLLERFQPKMDPQWGLAARQWANPLWSIACLGVLIVALFHPPHGFPVRLCAFHLVTGLDCPGCGMTRGLSLLWRGDLVAAMGQNLFAPAAFGYLLFQISYLFLPASSRAWVIKNLNQSQDLLRSLFWVGFVLFLAVGSLRFILEELGAVQPLG
jgi:hypothetical protein